MKMEFDPSIGQEEPSETLKTVLAAGPIWLKAI